MSIKSKVFAATATLTLVGGVGAAGAMSASAATPSCGGSCIDIFSHEFGTHAHPNFVLDVLRQGEKVGQPIILFRTSNSDPAEDFTYLLPGPDVRLLHGRPGLRGLNLHYGGGAKGFPDDPAFEIQYSPYGVDSGLCMGLSTTAVYESKV